jgi:ATP-binding cassette subfamily B protein
MGLSTFLLFLSTLNGTISVGAFAAIFAALGQIFDIMQSVMRWDINGITREVGKVTNFFRILDLPERTGIEGTHNFTKGIVVENVSFIYPGRDEHALSNVSLTITDGETIAIVGENGSGKSTLVRLLTGMYTPSEGRVLIGGLDTIFTAPSSIYYDISGVFQEYQRYKMTLFDNVIISNTKIEHDKSTVEEVLKDAGFKLDVNNIELDTMLSPEFEGIELSGGQWQRLAIARGLYRRNNFIVLDEPTAAIDPLEENMIFTQFKKLIKGKCAVLVTHRLGPARLANRIIVMDAGEIIDVGTHEELLSRPGKYADMWAAQVQWYER